MDGDHERRRRLTSLVPRLVTDVPDGAFLVAQTRVESGIHSFLEVSYGALLGSLAVLVMFQVFA